MIEFQHYLSAEAGGAMNDLTQYLGVALGLLGALLVAQSSRHLRRLGFATWVLSNLLLIAYTALTNAWALSVMYHVYLITSIWGWWTHRPQPRTEDPRVTVLSATVAWALRSARHSMDEVTRLEKELTETRAEVKQLKRKAPANDFTCPVCGESIERMEDLISTGYINYHKKCNVMATDAKPNDKDQWPGRAPGHATSTNPRSTGSAC